MGFFGGGSLGVFVFGVWMLGGFSCAGLGWVGDLFGGRDGGWMDGWDCGVWGLGLV